MPHSSQPYPAAALKVHVCQKLAARQDVSPGWKAHDAKVHTYIVADSRGGEKPKSPMFERDTVKTPSGVATMACTHVVKYDCQGRDCPVSTASLDGTAGYLSRGGIMCSPVAHGRNLGHLEREESWLRCEVRSLLCHVHLGQSSQDLAQLESA